MFDNKLKNIMKMDDRIFIIIICFKNKYFDHLKYNYIFFIDFIIHKC